MEIYSFDGCVFEPALFGDIYDELHMDKSGSNESLKCDSEEETLKKDPAHIAVQWHAVAVAQGLKDEGDMDVVRSLVSSGSDQQEQKQQHPIRTQKKNQKKNFEQMKCQFIPVVNKKMDSNHSQIKDIQSFDTLSLSSCTKLHVSTRKPITKSVEEVTHKLVKEHFSHTNGKSEHEQVSLIKDDYQDLTSLKSSDPTKNLSLKDLREKNIDQAGFELLNTLRHMNLKFPNPVVYILSAHQTHPSHIGDIPWQYLREEVWRLHTFCKYPQNTNKSALLLAKNGFAYLGSGRDGDDSVICSFCTVYYKGWQPRDEIASVHAKLRSDCPLINGKDCGNVPLPHPSEGADLFTKLRPQPITRSAERMEMDSVTEGPSQEAGGTATAYQAINTNAISSTISSNTTTLNTSGMSSSNLNQTAGVLTGASQELADPTTRAQNQPAQSTLENQGPPSSSLPQSQSSSQMVRLEEGNNRELAQSSVHNNTPNPNAQIGRGSVHEAGNNSDPAQVHANSQAPSQDTFNNSTTGQEASNTRVVTQSASRVFTATTESQSQQPSRPATSQTPAESSTTSNSSSNERSGEANGGSFLHLGIITDRPKRFEFAVKVARLRSFEGWPADHHLTKEVLSDAGFYYAGYGDCARCFYCGGGLRNWEQDDDVWVEHARWFPKCAFIRQTKGAAFIEAVQRLNSSQGNISYQDVLDALGPQRNFLDSKEAALKRDAAVIAVQSAGYSEHDAVAVAQALKDEGQMLSADKLFEKLQEENYPRRRARLDNESRSVRGASNLARDEETISNLKVQNQELRQQTVCKICMDNDVAVVFLPCGHFVSCSECASALHSCPVCRHPVRGIVRAFIG